MAFQSGVLNGTHTLTDILTLLKDFAVADGWTVNYFTYPYLHMRSGDCWVNLFANTAPTMNDLHGASASATAPDHRIDGHLSSGFTANANPATQYNNQPDSPIVVTGTSAQVVSNDFTAPFAKYWLFSGAAGEPKYIHLVVQKANGRFCHLSFGNVDKKGAAYTPGGAFLGGVFWTWGFNVATDTDNITSLGSSIGGLHSWLGDATQVGNITTYNLYVGTLAGAERKVLHGSAAGTAFDTLVALMSRQNDIKALSQFDYSVGRWLGHLFFLGPNPINGRTPLFELPLMWANSVTQRNRLIGSLPGLRWASMIGRTEAEEITYGSEAYMIFPIKRALPWNPEPFPAKIVTSGPFGFAYKKNP